MRKLSESFLRSLKENDGILHPILDRVKKDDTLMLAIRHDYVNIYYRGGNLLRLKEKANTGVEAHFDKSYETEGNKSFHQLNVPEKIRELADSKKWVSAVPYLKEIMDFHINTHSKPEREFQQIVARENNHSPISDSTEYFITDIEYKINNPDARFDMLAVYWPAKKTGSNCRVALIEMKYGNNTLKGDSGLIDHLKDIEGYLSKKESYQNLIDTVTTQFEQLAYLDLIKHKECSTGSKIQLNADHQKPELIFILANLNPRSTVLRDELAKADFKEFTKSPYFELRFFIGRDAGYGMYSGNMVTYEDYLELRGF